METSHVLQSGRGDTAAAGEDQNLLLSGGDVPARSPPVTAAGTRGKGGTVRQQHEKSGIRAAFL